ncbi:MAG: histidinol-phosphate aminotransferase family protein [Elusimicrobia bacterium]|nr:histidinol-phosphate aminotransferase family protein [Elusimicrobiota bacterium]
MSHRRFKPHLLALERYRTSSGRDMEEGLCLDRNERVVPFPKSVMADLRRGLTSRLLNYYPDPAGFYDKLSRFTSLPADHLYLTNGITESIRVLYETLTEPGDEVLVVDPTYPMYRIYSSIYRVNHRAIGFDERPELRLSDIDSGLSGRTAFVCVPNPNLPIESYVGVPFLRDLARRCQERGAFLVVDEAYGFFGAETAAGLIGEFDNVIILQTCSKAFGLAGARVGYMMSRPETISYLSKTRSLVESNSLSMAVASYMLDHPDIMKNYARATQEGRDKLRRGLAAMGARWLGGDRTNAMLVFLRDNEAVKDLVAQMRKKKIYIRASFEKPLDRAVRVTLGPRKAMEAFLKEFKTWAKANPGRLSA